MLKIITKYIFVGITLTLIFFASFLLLMVLNHNFFITVVKYFVKPSHYSVSGSNFDGNWIVDNQYSLVLENEGQAIYIDKNFIYSYGKNGYICLDEDNSQIKVYCDENTKKEAIMKWARYQRTYKNQLILINNIDDLLPKEKQYYYELKKQQMKYPFIY